MNDDELKGFDVNKIVSKFGASRVDDDVLDRMVRVCKLNSRQDLHHFFLRGIVISHRDLDAILDDVEAGRPIYLYTGRGPSSEHMHIGHLVPFTLAKYLQKLFNCSLYIQISDDEKFLFRGVYPLCVYKTLALYNIKDIVACGFDPDKTFIFINSDAMTNGILPALYPNSLKIMQKITYNQMRSCFGLKSSDNIGKAFFPAIQMAPALSSTFFGDHSYKPKCLVVCSIDQDPYFRLLRDVAPGLNEAKPSVIHTTFLPSLVACTDKMSSSHHNETTIFLNEDADTISSKIHKSFSGGQDTIALHRKFGGNTDIDVAFRYLYFFLDDDEQLLNIQNAYRSGDLLTTELKKICASVITTIIKQHQSCRRTINERSFALGWNKFY